MAFENKLDLTETEAEELWVTGRVSILRLRLPNGRARNGAAFPEIGEERWISEPLDSRSQGERGAYAAGNVESRDPGWQRGGCGRREARMGARCTSAEDIGPYHADGRGPLRKWRLGLELAPLPLPPTAAELRAERSARARSGRPRAG